MKPCFFLACIALFFMILGCRVSQKSRTSENGFISIFDGKTLNGWEGDSTYWYVKNGIMVGEIVPATILKRNTFIIWRGGVTSDFELNVDYKISTAGNSGINYRSSELKDLPYAMKGYQADIDGANKYTGQNYEERGRAFLALRGQKVVLEDNKKPIVINKIANTDTLKAIIKPEWNQYHLIVQGNHLQHYLNGILMSDVIDNDTINRKMTGLLGVQVHVGPPMKVEYKNFRIKKL